MSRGRLGAISTVSAAIFQLSSSYSAILYFCRRDCFDRDFIRVPHILNRHASKPPRDGEVYLVDACDADFGTNAGDIEDSNDAIVAPIDDYDDDGELNYDNESDGISPTSPRWFGMSYQEHCRNTVSWFNETLCALRFSYQGSGYS